jgi:hypothetical protein
MSKADDLFKAVGNYFGPKSTRWAGGWGGISILHEYAKELEAKLEAAEKAIAHRDFIIKDIEESRKDHRPF